MAADQPELGQRRYLTPGPTRAEARPGEGDTAAGH
jgi:hypothetical protein